MLTAGLFLIMFIALCGVFLFPVNTLMGLLCALIAGGTLAAYLLFLKKLPKRIGQIIEFAVLILSIVLLLNTHAKGQEHPLMEYALRLADAEMVITHQEKNAEKTLKKLEKDFGESDATISLHVLYCLLDDDPEGAQEYLDAFRTHGKEYYMRKELYYIFDTENDTTDDLQRLYLEAAEELPDWEYAQRMAGISQFDRENYISAGYYLTASLELEPTQPDSLYYLGAIAFKNQEYDQAVSYFQRSMDNGAGEMIRSWILWHLDQMEGEEDDEEE
ncbi:MAG: hypothetical protein K6B72_07540 [Lachnospiraceae bacterium]|nr:hypothetical protein [Lachnospiraceae bacterium]